MKSEKQISNLRKYPLPYPKEPPYVPTVLPTETKVESGTSQNKSGISVNLSNSGVLSDAGCKDYPLPGYSINPFLVQLVLATRWSTTFSSKVDLPHTIDFRVLCGAKLVT